MEKIDWKEAKDKSAAYTHLQKLFGVKRPAISLAMSFKRNSLQAAQMREVAISELGGKLLNDFGMEIKTTKVLDSKGNVIRVITNK